MARTRRSGCWSCWGLIPDRTSSPPWSGRCGTGRIPTRPWNASSRSRLGPGPPWRPWPRKSGDCRPGWVRTRCLPDRCRTTKTSANWSRTRMKPRTPLQAKPARTEPRQKILEDFQALGIPLGSEQLAAVLGRAESEGLSHLEFLRLLISEQADGRRERRMARRIREAGFAETKTLVDFDWQFNAAVIDRVRIETLATAEFIGRRQYLVWVGQSGVGKSHLIQAIGQRACVLGYRVRYETSASILQELTAALADRTLVRRLRSYAK